MDILKFRNCYFIKYDFIIYKEDVDDSLFYIF